ncbi:rRNA biogenesis protein RRP5, partial [Tremellales sp. Uapishka_1]
MSFPSKKRAQQGDSQQKFKKPRVSEGKEPVARAAPAFLSALKDEETDFPRGGGSSLTPLELKETWAEGRREADEEARAENSKAGSKPKGKQISERQAKRIKKAEVDEMKKEREKDNIRVEELNYKRLIPGTHLLTRIHTVLPLHLILSLPNNLLAHVPITEITSTLTNLLNSEVEDAAESTTSKMDQDEESENEASSAPDLATLFQPGQYFPAKVLNLYPTASQTFISQYPMSETTRLAARVEMTLVPEKVNAEVAKADLGKGYHLVGEVKAEEDKGWRVGLGLPQDDGSGGVEGWVSRTEVEKFFPSQTLIVGQLLPTTINNVKAGGRVAELSLDPVVYSRNQLTEVSTVGSLLPGHCVTALITAVVPSGLNLRICGFFDGTIDLAHLGIGEEDIEEKFKVGKKVKARVIYDTLTSTPRRFALSILPHLLDFSSAKSKTKKTPVEEAIPIGTVLQSVKVTRVIPEWGVVCRTDDGQEGFVHISHLADERLAALSTSTSQYKAGTLHRARVIGHSPLDGILLLSFEQKVLDQVFMQVDELKIGQILKGTIRRLSDKGLFVNVQGSVDGVVWPLHYADIRLKHPEKRFKVGSTVKCRVFALEPTRNRVVLTLKKSLVDSTLETPSSFDECKVGQIVPAVVSKILDKGCIVDLFGGLRAFVPQSEASQNFIKNLSDIFFEGKPLQVRITEVHPDSGKLVVSVRQALPSALAAGELQVGTAVTGQVSQIHAEQVVVTLVPSQLTALLSLSNLSNHRHLGVDELKASLKIGEKLDDLVVVSKNSTTGLLIVANKPTGHAAANGNTSGINHSGVSRSAVSMDSIQPGQTVVGTVIASSSQGTMVQLANSLKGRIHPTDQSDNLEDISKSPLRDDQEVSCFVLKVNPSSRIIDLSTRRSRLESSDEKIADKEIEKVSDLKVDTKIRGLVKNVSAGGLFVSLGRTITARIMIRELFDDFVKDWQSKFHVNQLVSGKILKIDVAQNQVEMTLRKTPSKPQNEAMLSLGDFAKDQKVICIVKKVEAYGMFLKIEGTEVSGLCHKSQISDNKKQDVAQALKGFREGDKVKAKITSVDLEKRKINFGIKASYFGEDELEEADEIEEGEGDEDVGDEDEEDDEEDDDEDEPEGEDGEFDEDEDEEVLEGLEEDSEEETVLELTRPSAPGSTAKASLSKAPPKPAPASALEVSGGFDWTGDAASASEASDSESESDSEIATAALKTKTKSKSKAQGQLTDLTATAPDSQPESATEFERALLASPNSSFLWLQYMSFQLQLHEVDKARSIGRKALEKIDFREEEEKLNVWMALVNLEIGFGTQDSLDKVFKEAAQYNDAKTVWFRYADALQLAGKDDVVEDIYKQIVKKFSNLPESWTRFADYLLKKENVDAARALLPRSLKSLDKSKHVETIEKMAILEFKHGDAERGKTLFEGIVDKYPKRLDLWNVYIDQLTKLEDIQGVRGLFLRAIDQKLTSKKAKFLFKKWLGIEGRIGDVAGQEKAKERAKQWVGENANVGQED